MVCKKIDDRKKHNNRFSTGFDNTDIMSNKDKQVEENKKSEYADYPNILKYSLKYALLHCGIPTFLFAFLYLFTDISIFGKLFIVFMVAANFFYFFGFVAILSTKFKSCERSESKANNILASNQISFIMDKYKRTKIIKLFSCLNCN